MRRLLFPEEPRDFAGRRELKIVLRALHVLCAAAFFGAFVFDVAVADRAPWFWGVLASGVAVLGLDVHESAAFFCQVRGVVVLAKIAVLACLPWFGPAQVWVLGALILVSVVSSHAPGRIRHHMLFGADRLQGAKTHG